MEQAPHEAVVVKSAPWARLLRLVLQEYETATMLIPDGPQEEDQAHQEEVQEEVQEEQ